MRLRICTRNPATLHVTASVPDDLHLELLPGAQPCDTRFDEGRLFSQRISGKGFRMADFHITLHQPVELVPESDNEVVLITYLLEGQSAADVQAIPGRIHLTESNAYLLQFIPGPDNKVYLKPGTYRTVVLLFEGEMQDTLLSEYPRLQPANRDQQPKITGELPYPPVRLSFKDLYHLGSIMRYQGTPNRVGPFLQSKVRTLLYRLMVRLDEQDEVQQKMREVKDYIRSNLDQRPTTEQLRKIAGMNRNALARHFKASTGKTLKRYILNERMTRACLLTDRGGENLKTVLEMLGYKNTSNFSADFRKWCGRPLRELRADPRSMLPKSAFS